MKTLFTLALCLLALPVARADEDKKAEKKAEKLPTVGDYEKVLKYYTDWSDNLTNPDHWKKTTFTNKETKKVRKFPELSEFEKQIFYFMSAEKLTNQMKQMAAYWQAELKKFDKKTGEKLRLNLRGVQEDEKEKERLAREATKAEVEGYCNQLLALRKKTAARFEAMGEKLFATYKDKFTKEEGEQIMKQIRDFHDQEKLIERKK
jgi:hypothetical protein